MEVKKIVEGMTAVEVAEVIDSNFKNQNKILEEDIATQNSVIGVSEYKDFSEAEAVNVGDVRKYDGFLYECVEATTGAFDASKWKKSSFKAETEKKLSELESEVKSGIGGEFFFEAVAPERTAKINAEFKKGDELRFVIDKYGREEDERYVFYQDVWEGVLINSTVVSAFTYIAPNDFNKIIIYNNGSNLGYKINLRVNRTGRIGALEDEIANIEAKMNETDAIIENLASKVEEVDSNLTDIQDTFVDENKESLYITDINGNIIAEIGKEGITTTALFVKDENAIKNLLEMLKEIQKNDSDGVEDILPIEDDALYITDNNYNIFLSIAKNEKGEYVFDYVGKGRAAEVGNSLYGKNIYSLGDSLSVSGDWQKRLCKLTGAKFDSNLNYQNFSYGGTATYSGLNSGRDRAKKLVEYAKKGNQVDYVFLENINDVNKVGTEDISTDGLPLMLGDVISFTDRVFGTYTECITYFRENINSIIGGITPKVGSEIILYYSGEKTSTNINVIGSPKKSGQITIIVGGRSYGIQVTANMTTKEVVNKILEYSYEGYTDELASDGVSVTFTALDASTSADVSFVDTDSTGIEVYLSIIGAASKVTLTYGSLSLTTESWLNGDNWTKNYGTESWSTETLARVYKGLIEYLQRELPTAKIIWLIPTSCSYNYVNGAKREDGTLDYEAAYSSNYATRYRKLCDFQKKICTMYGIEYIDLNAVSGISFVNAYPLFYPNNNVHPNLLGYERWGECISRILTGC